MGDSGESSGNGAGERPFGDRTRASLMVLGEAIAMLNGRLDAQDRRIGELQAALISLARTLGVSPVWSDERGNRPATH